MSEKVNFTIPHLGGHKRAPSVFAAACMYLTAAVGLTLGPLVINALQSLCASLLPGLDNAFFVDLSNIVFYGGFIVLPLFIYMRSRSGLSDAMRLNGVTTHRAILCALAGVIGLFFTNFLSYPWMMLIEAVGGRLTESTLSIPSTPSALCVMIVFVAVLPGVCEELLFRGAILSAWEKTGSVRAILASTLLFASLHANVEGLPSELVNGIVLGVIAVSTDSLFACMIYHTVFNATALIVSYVLQFSVPETAEATTLLSSIGGVAGLIPILFNLLLSGALLFSLLRALDRLRLFEGRRVFGNEEGRPHQWTWPELIMLLAGAGIMAMWYVYSVLRIAGVIR